MRNLNISKLADWLENKKTKIYNHDIKINSNKIYTSLNNLNIFPSNVSKYLDITQEKYYETLSDNKLNLSNNNNKIYLMSDVKDRIVINHVNGDIDKNYVSFTYNHINVFPNGVYNFFKDIDVLIYGLEIIGAVSTIDVNLVKNNISSDAFMSLILSINGVSNW